MHCWCLCGSFLPWWSWEEQKPSCDPVQASWLDNDVFLHHSLHVSSSSSRRLTSRGVSSPDTVSQRRDYLKEMETVQHLSRTWFLQLVLLDFHFYVLSSVTHNSAIMLIAGDHKTLHHETPLSPGTTGYIVCLGVSRPWDSCFWALHSSETSFWMKGSISGEIGVNTCQMMFHHALSE